VRLATVLLAAGLLAVSAPQAAHAAGLRVTIDDGVDEVQPGDDVTYTITFTNDEAQAATGTIVASVPAYASIADAPDGTVSGTDASWPVTVEPGQAVTLTLDVNVGEVPDDVYSVTTTASVYLGDPAAASPTIRSADADSIPGHEPRLAAGEGGDKATGAARPVLPVLVSVVAVLIIAGVVVGLLIARRRRHGAENG